MAQGTAALANKILERAAQAGIMLTTAESCTGGMLAAALTEIPGASAVFDRGFVTYSNAAKTALLGVPEALIAQHGAVSEEVAQAMALGALKHSTAQLAISITGIAGPGGGTAEKPVGLVHFGLAKTPPVSSGLSAEAQKAQSGDRARGSEQAQIEVEGRQADRAVSARKRLPMGSSVELTGDKTIIFTGTRTEIRQQATRHALKLLLSAVKT